MTTTQLLDTGPVLPHDLEAEKAVLGGIMLNQARIADVIGILSPLDFFRQGHRDTFGAMLALHQRGEAIDFVTVRSELAKTARLEAEDPVYLATLTDGQTRSNNVSWYAQIVREKAAERAMVVLGRQVIETALKNPAAIGNGFPARAREELERIAGRWTGTSGPVALAMSMPEITAYEFPHRAALLWRGDTPIMRAGHIAQIYGLRGIGKTWVSDTLAIVSATGTDALGFSAPEPCRVLYIDGEMAAEEIKSRQALLCGALNVLDTPNLIRVAADWQDGHLPRLDTAAGQAFVEPHVADADLIVLDNRSTLFDPEGESDPTAWQPAQDWLLSLRRRGKAVIVVHHSNRQGGARGHSKPEDVMNLLVKLSRPEDYRADQGARFTVEFEKARGAHGAAVLPFTAQFTSSGWCIESDTSKGSDTTSKLREYLRLAADAREWPKSANAAIRAAHVNRNEGLRVWGELLRRGEITKRTDGGFELDDADAT